MNIIQALSRPREFVGLAFLGLAETDAGTKKDWALGACCPSPLQLLLELQAAADEHALPAALQCLHHQHSRIRLPSQS